MLVTNRLFERNPPSREAKSIYIFCEGKKREFQYFNYFREMDSRINLEIYRLHSHENNSPQGLLNIARTCIIASRENPSPKYSFQKNDEVWIVLDSDPDKHNSRKPQIQQIREECGKREGWFFARSNPCFEVWLYYHSQPANPEFEGKEACKNWKALVGQSIKGGFDSKRHPLFIEEATSNSEKIFESKGDEPMIGCTELFLLSKRILPIIESKLKYVKGLLQ